MAKDMGTRLVPLSSVRAFPMGEVHRRAVRSVLKDKAYLAFIRQQPCCIPGHDCQGPIDAHHAAKRSGMGLKASDHDTLPLCRQGHIYERHPLAGYFQGWTKVQVKAWESDMILKYRELYVRTSRGALDST